MSNHTIYNNNGSISYSTLCISNEYINNYFNNTQNNYNSNYNSTCFSSNGVSSMSYNYYSQSSNHGWYSNDLKN